DLLKALHEADESLAMRLIDKSTNVNVRDENGITPLMWAALRGNPDLVSGLLKAGADPNLQAEGGMGPLQIAISNQARALALLLLEHGAKANAVRDSGETALMTAARMGQLEVMKALIARRADVNAREKRFYQTALMWSAGHPDQVKLLIEH